MTVVIEEEANIVDGEEGIGEDGVGKIGIGGVGEEVGTKVGEHGEVEAGNEAGLPTLPRTASNIQLILGLKEVSINI